MYTNGKTGARVAEAYDALATSNVFTAGPARHKQKFSNGNWKKRIWQPQTDGFNGIAAAPSRSLLLLLSTENGTLGVTCVFRRRRGIPPTGYSFFFCVTRHPLLFYFFCLPPIRLLHRSIPIFSCEAVAFVNNPSKNPANVPFRFLWIDNDCVSLLNIYTDFFFSFPAPNRKKLEVGSLPLRWPAAFCWGTSQPQRKVFTNARYPQRRPISTRTLRRLISLSSVSGHSRHQIILGALIRIMFAEERNSIVSIGDWELDSGRN